MNFNGFHFNGGYSKDLFLQLIPLEKDIKAVLFLNGNQVKEQLLDRIPLMIDGLNVNWAILKIYEMMPELQENENAES